MIEQRRGVKVTGLTHWAIPVNDLDETRRFYTDVLGMEDRGPVGDHFYCVTFGDTDVLLTKRPEPGPATYRAADRMHYAFRVSDEDFDRAAQHAREWGVTVVPEAAINPLDGDVEIRRRGTYVGRSLYLLDPSGNRIELYSPTLPPERA